MTAHRIVSSYIARVQEAIESIEPDKVTLLTQAIVNTLNNKGKIVIAGNGGSASTANHMVNDLIMARNFKAKAAQVISLTDNQAIFSAIGNDFSFEQVFSKQIETLCEAKDLLILISASGNSSNLIKAFEEASRIGMQSAAILGFDGGKLKNLVEIAIHAKTRIGDYGPAEDIALVVNHAIAAALRSEVLVVND